MAEARSPRDQYSFEVTSDTANARDLVESGETLERASMAGRILALRDQGRIVFGDLFDQEGSLQVIAEEGSTDHFDDFAKITLGDWIGVEGTLGVTKRGEPSIFADRWVPLAETELPFPGKQGLRDPETIARQRYVDLAVNRDSLERFKQRSKIVSTIRRELEARDFTEVETPILQPLYGGAAARPFETHHNALDMELYLRIAPELYLKRLVVGGLTRVFEIGKVFRNEGISTRHNPEFTMMEVYAAYWDHEKQMELTEQLVSTVAEEVTGSAVIEYQGRTLDLTPPWPKVPMDALVSRQLGEEVTVETDIDHLRALCRQYDIPYEKSFGPGKLLLELYEKTVESDLWGPIFVTEYPEEVSPLARSHRDRPGYTERFEGIVGGSEICNGFSELNDPREQYLRFKEQEKASEHDDEAMPMDHDYIRALKYGLPPTAGLGIGIDRLVMLVTDSSSIRDVVLFPTLRPDGYVTEYE
ncbi:MAG TPA: lysine--tRNA ligase [Candidatus Saccharimonadales bacterium]|nr:lysine--tRNA ligase [Candidatus Saccharimonadales bacterium]